MKLFCRLMNVLALVAVLLLGAVPAHASEPHEHPSVHDVASDHERVIADDEGHWPDEPAMHCGAPILDVDPVRLECALQVSSIAYYVTDPARPLRVSITDLRPPRS